MNQIACGALSRLKGGKGRESIWRRGMRTADNIGASIDIQRKPGHIPGILKTVELEKI